MRRPPLFAKRRNLLGLALFAAFFAVCGAAWGQEAASNSPHQKIISQIRKRGFKRVAVLPQALVHKLDLENAEKSQVKSENTLGPLSTVWASELYDELVNASGAEFEVVPQSTVLAAVAGKKLSEVAKDEFWDLIMKRTGADSVVFESITDPGPEDGGKVGAPKLGTNLQLVDAKSGAAAGSLSRVYVKSLSDAAYAGESFVVREWKGEELEPTGLSKAPYFEMGLRGEQQQYENLRGGLGHPLQREDYPYGVAVVVNGEIRPPLPIDDRLYVPLRIGEKYQLRIWNHGEKTVYAAVYVDGLNTIGQRRERPSDTDTNRTWWLRPTPLRAATIEGWFNHDVENNFRAKVNEFEVVGADRSLSRMTLAPGEETFGAANGMITAVFYTYGVEGIPLTKSVALPPESTIGTGKGAAIDSRVSEFETEKKLKGLMLSAMTLYYRTPEQIEALQREHQESGQLVKLAEGEAAPIDANDRPKESQITREEARKLGVEPPKEESTPSPPEKPKKPSGLAPGSDRP